jgi:polysaccharide chain length determinant protein (PEP-CTERM system associated)
MDSLRLQLQRYLKAAWQRRWIALGAAWLICVAGWVGVYLIPNQYESSARLYVDTDAVLTPLLKGIAADSSTTGQIDILQRTLLSRPNLQKLVSKTDLDLTLKSPEDRERLIQQLATDIKIKPQTKTLFTIEYRNPSPKLAYDVVQTLLNIFIESATGSNRADMENARRFIDRQIAAYDAQLTAAERRRAEFRSRYLSILPQDSGDNGFGATRLDQVRGQVIALNGQLQDAMIRRDGLQQELAKTPPTISSEAEAAAGGGSRLQQAEEQLRELRLRYTDDFPDVIATRNLIASLKASPPAGGGGRAAGRGRASSNMMYEQLKLKLVDAEAGVGSLKRQLAEATKERDTIETLAKQAPGVLAEYKALDRDYGVLKKDHDELLTRREAAQLAQAAETQADKVKLNIVDPPQVPRLPVTPNRLILIPAVLLVGLGAGVGISFLLSQFDRSFRTIEDLRDLGLPVLGGVSLLGAAISPRRVASTIGFCAGLLVLVVVFGGLLAYVLRTQAMV